jgi:hypothetical protein
MTGARPATPVIDLQNLNKSPFGHKWRAQHFWPNVDLSNMWSKRIQVLSYAVPGASRLHILSTPGWRSESADIAAIQSEMGAHLPKHADRLELAATPWLHEDGG